MKQQQKLGSGRFNEEIDQPSLKGSLALSSRNVAQLKTVQNNEYGGTAQSVRSSHLQKSVRSRAIMSAKSRSSVLAKTQAEGHRKKIVDLVNNLSDQELEKVSQILRQQEIEEKQAENEKPQLIDEMDLMVKDVHAQEFFDTYARKCAVSDKLTSMSHLTSKTFISNLQRQLEEERQARTKLEGELKTLKDLQAEI